MTKKMRQIFLAALILVLCHATIAKADDVTTNNSYAAFTVKVTGTGRPMILIPGLSCGGDVWDGTVAHFKDHYECHVLTLAGFAGQPAIHGPFLGQVITGLQKYIRDQKLDHPIIIGHSLGGLLAYALASSAPKQVGPVIAVDGLPFISPIFAQTATVESSRPFAEQYRAMFNSQTQEGFAASNRKALESMITDPKNVDVVDATSKKSDPKAVGEAVYEDMITDLRPRVKLIESPVLLIGATTANAETTALYQDEVSTIPKHKVVFAPNAKHFVQLDDPQFFYTQVETFLKESETSGAK